MPYSFGRDTDRGMNFRAEAQPTGDVWLDVRFAPECYVEFAVDPDGRVSLHGLTIHGDHNRGGKDPISGTTITGQLADRLRDVASRVSALHPSTDSGGPG